MNKDQVIKPPLPILSVPETRSEWEARTGRTLTWDDIVCDPTERFACQMCSSEEFDTFETDGFGHGVEPGAFWTYCRRCDCWTEHPPTYREPDNGD